MRTDEQYRHECEVRDCIKRYYPHGDLMAAYLAKVAKRRGEEAAERLRNDALVAWQARKVAA